MKVQLSGFITEFPATMVEGVAAFTRDQLMDMSIWTMNMAEELSDAMIVVDGCETFVLDGDNRKHMMDKVGDDLYVITYPAWTFAEAV